MTVTTHANLFRVVRGIRCQLTSAFEQSFSLHVVDLHAYQTDLVDTCSPQLGKHRCIFWGQAVCLAFCVYLESVRL